MARDLKSLGAAFHAAAPAQPKRADGPDDIGDNDDIDEVNRALDAELESEIDATVRAELGSLRVDDASVSAPSQTNATDREEQAAAERPRQRRRRSVAQPGATGRIKTSVSLPVGTAELLRSAAAEFGVSTDGMLMRMYLDVHELLEPTRQNEELVALGILPARRPRGEPTVVMSISLTPEAAARLDELARRLGVSRSAAVDRVVRTARPNA